MSDVMPGATLHAASATRNKLLLHHFFEHTAGRTPEAYAVDVPPGADRPGRIQITYAELARHVELLVLRLQSSVSGECVVGILLSRNSGLLYAAQLAVLKAGAAYTCIDPAFSTGQIGELLDDAGAVALITDAAGVARLREDATRGIQVIRVDDALLPLPEGKAPHCDPAWLTPSSLAYVVYTSGTTGRPKGVMIEHQCIVNLVQGDLDEFKLSAGDRVAQGSSAAYDSSIEETWLALASGATVVVMDDDAARLGPDLIDWLRAERITVFCPPPTLLRATGCSDPEAALPDLKLLYVGGEALPQDVADRWARGRRMVNGYGPTECTVTCLRAKVKPFEAITIGLPVPGQRAWILDETLREVVGDGQGELCIGGIGLARGYRDQESLTAEKFISHPLLGRLYRTGDLVHRDRAGQVCYDGRIDSQVKIRGYRVELSGIEARLAECDGVRAAACHLQDEGGVRVLVAFVVPDDPTKPPSFDALKSALARDLPAHMVPARFGILPILPTSVGGKLNRAALPRLGGLERQSKSSMETPRNGIETLLERAFRESLNLSQAISIHDDFFKDLGGDSLSAAILVSLLRADEETAWVTVRNVYEARTVAALGARVPATRASVASTQTKEKKRNQGQPFVVTLLQAAWLLLVFSIASIASYVLAFRFAPWVSDGIGLVPTLLLAPAIGLAAFLIYAPLSVGFAVVVKRIAIGRYRPLRAPVWGGLYLRNWIVQQAVRMVPWRSFEGTVFQQSGLRALGASIGQRVHIHRGVNLLRGGWDLLDIGDDVTLSHSAAVELVTLDAGDIVIAPVKLGAGVTLDIRAHVGGNTVLEEGAYLTALSSLPEGGRIPRFECWDGIPARPAGLAMAPPPLSGRSRAPSPALHGLALSFARAGLLALLALPLELLTIAVCLIQGVSANDMWDWLYHPAPGWTPWIVGLGVVALAVPLTLAFEAWLMRLLGAVPTGAIDRWGWAYIRVWLKTDLVESAGRWLSGTLFWPAWLRAAGMKIGADCEISTIIDVIPEHIEIGAESFFADGIYLGGPRIHRGVVSLKKTRLGRNTFLGNHVVIPAGQVLPDNVLLGVCTVADAAVIRTGTSWFGLPPFELPRREVVELDRHLTHEPTSIRYVNRVFWEMLRFALPITPLLVLIGWFRLLAAPELTALPMFLPVIVPLVSLAVVFSLCAFVLALKWILLGRVRAGQHALWSCWCSRWDFLYVAWGQYAAPALTQLEGTLLLSWYLRAMGMKIGSRVVLGGGFAQVVDPDMIHIEDEATVNAAYQAHTFEDRVLKIDHVLVRRGATLGSDTVPLYGADVGEGTYVAAHSVIMKRERLLAGRRYAGAPTRQID